MYDDIEEEVTISKSQVLNSIDTFKQFMLQNDNKEGYALAKKIEKVFYDLTFSKNLVQPTVDSFL
jgi:hypothetical protein